MLIADIMRRRLTLTGSTLRPRSVEFKTMVADEIARTVWPYVGGRAAAAGDRHRPSRSPRLPPPMRAWRAGEHVGKIVLEVGG